MLPDNPKDAVQHTWAAELVAEVPKKTEGGAANKFRGSEVAPTFLPSTIIASLQVQTLAAELAAVQPLDEEMTSAIQQREVTWKQRGELRRMQHDRRMRDSV